MPALPAFPHFFVTFVFFVPSWRDRSCGGHAIPEFRPRPSGTHKRKTPPFRAGLHHKS
ncbi:MAG: hypothetical protein JWO31_3343 [Phycisphaerales bacterium]|nr:hypothetical protein [Phycisphaerales bacterium]